MAELVVDLTNPESVELARLVLAALDPNKASVPKTLAAATEQTPPWEPDPAVGGSQIAAEPADVDPWADDTPTDSKPAAATTAPSEGDSDDDDPWS